MWWLVATVLLILGLSWLGRRWLPERQARKRGAGAGGRRAPEAAAAELAGQIPDVDAPATGCDVEIGDELDLHGVPPADVAELVDAFVDVSLRRGRRTIRIVHGKGIGEARRTVRARLERHPGVARFADAPPPSGWGATVVELHAQELDGSEPGVARQPPSA
ncbi:MAG: Smr/MutS family protein [Candidatus Krumholzibacteriia bacterium]